MDEFEKEIKTIFLDEAQQNLADAEDAFMALDRGDNSADLIDKIFRLAHNFKGSAMAVGFVGLSTFAHKMEDVISRIKAGDLMPSKDICGVLLQASDALRAYVEGLKANLEYVHPVGELEQILIAIKNGPAAVPAPTPTSINSLPVDVIAATSDRAVGINVAHPAVPPAPTKSAPPKSGSAAQAAANKEEDSIRIGTGKLDQLLNLVGELVVNQSMLNTHRLSGSVGSDHALQTLAYVDKIVVEIQNVSIGLRMVAVKPVFQKLRRIVRDLSSQQSKDIDFIVEGEHVEIDKSVLELVSDPLTHLIRNAVDHGVETAAIREQTGKPRQSRVVLKAEHKEDNIQISISDDGKGLDAALLIRKAKEKGLIAADAVLSDAEAHKLIFAPGFSTKEQVTDVSGRGVGMDVVMRAVEELKGRIDIETVIGKGTSFVMSLPLSLAIIPGVVVQVDGLKYVIPVSQMLETIEHSPAHSAAAGSSGRMINLRGEVIPIVSLSQVLGKAGRRGGSQVAKSAKTIGVITEYRGKKVSFEIEDIFGQQQIVLKRLGTEMEDLPGIIAGTILSNGEPGLILNLHELIGRKNHHAA